MRSHQFPDCPGGATGLINGETHRSFLGKPQFTPIATRTRTRTWDLGFWMIDAACEGCGRLESALLLRLCHAGGCSSVWQPLPLWHGHALTGLEHQHAAAAAAVGGGEDLWRGRSAPTPDPVREAWAVCLENLRRRAESESAGHHANSISQAGGTPLACGWSGHGKLTRTRQRSYMEREH